MLLFIPVHRFNMAFPNGKKKLKRIAGAKHLNREELQL